jgi:hypothetical protein
MQIRSTKEADLDRILACRVNEQVGGVTQAKYRQGLAAGSYRPS